MTGGGYVKCFTDITAEAEARAGLENARAELEMRVAERTQQLQIANAALGKATADKTRFLAAASHDLLQPLHAARLFTAALAGDVAPHGQPLLANVDRSIAAADQLLRALLDISKLDAGGIRPEPTRFALRALLAELVESFAPMAAEKRLALRLGPGDAWVETDRNLLRSVVQNFLSNAVRYTDRGGIVIGVRRRGQLARIEVRDTGLGIAAPDRDRIFREFERLGHGSEAGLGLGLAIAQRTAALLGAPIDLWSVPGRGSRFAVTLPGVAAGSKIAAGNRPRRLVEPGIMAGLRVLVIDDDAAIREGCAALLASWGCGALVAASGAAARAVIADADAALVDLDLGEADDGLALVAALRRARPGIDYALVTADRSAAIVARCAAAGVVLLAKPIDPARLAQWLSGANAQAAE
jgi:CheY-like chemotaxis protein